MCKKMPNEWNCNAWSVVEMPVPHLKVASLGAVIHGYRHCTWFTRDRKGSRSRLVAVGDQKQSAIRYTVNLASKYRQIYRKSKFPRIRTVINIATSGLLIPVSARGRNIPRVDFHITADELTTLSLVSSQITHPYNDAPTNGFTIYYYAYEDQNACREVKPEGCVWSDQLVWLYWATAIIWCVSQCAKLTVCVQGSRSSCIGWTWVQTNYSWIALEHEARIPF